MVSREPATVANLCDDSLSRQAPGSPLCPASSTAVDPTWAIVVAIVLTDLPPAPFRPSPYSDRILAAAPRQHQTDRNFASLRSDSWPSGDAHAGRRAQYVRYIHAALQSSLTTRFSRLVFRFCTSTKAEQRTAVHCCVCTKPVRISEPIKEVRRGSVESNASANIKKRSCAPTCYAAQPSRPTVGDGNHDGRKRWTRRMTSVLCCDVHKQDGLNEAPTTVTVSQREV